MKAALKPVLLTLVLTISAFTAVVYQSCKLDKCKAISCAYGGVCNDGVCTCLPGYEGANCETVTRKKYLSRLWQVREKGTVTPDRQYAIAIEPAAEINMVTIKNFYNYFAGGSIKAIVDRDTITIPNQQVQGKIIFGKGYIHSSSADQVNNIVTMRYIVVDSAQSNLVDDFGVYPSLDNSSPSNWIK